MQKVEIKFIDRKVAKAQQNKMAGSSGESDNTLIQSLKENAVNKNTLQSTNNWVKVWKSWASQKGYDESFEKYELEALNKILEQFYATVRKKDGYDYEPDILRSCDGYCYRPILSRLRVQTLYHSRQRVQKLEVGINKHS